MLGRNGFFSLLLGGLPAFLMAAPNNPGHLQLTSTATTVNLTWQDNSDNELGFKIYRDGHLVHITHANVTHYTDRGLQSHITYRYTVKATDDMQISDLGYQNENKTLIIHGQFTPNAHFEFLIDSDNRYGSSSKGYRMLDAPSRDNQSDYAIPFGRNRDLTWEHTKAVIQQDHQKEGTIS